MALSLSLSTDKADYAPGEAVWVTARYADPATTFTVTLTGTAHDDDGNVLATATTSYTVTPTGTPTLPVDVNDDQGGSYAVQGNANGVATLTGTAPMTGKHIVSGYGGAEPTPGQAGGGITWQGYTWELEDWGTAPGQPKASQVHLSPAGELVLGASEVAGSYVGSEIDSARGDQGIASNPSTWGYGTYRWAVNADLTKLPAGLCLGLFTYWSSSKGGPAGQKEIDIEFYSAGTVPGAPAFVQFGYYQDTPAGVTQGVPPGHTLVPGSQVQVPAGPLTVEFSWLPNSISWRMWAGTDTTAAPVATVTMTQGQKYNYQQLYGGNQFAGTVNIPVTGKQQVIANLWCPNSVPPSGSPSVAIPVTSFTYTQPL